MESHEFHKEHIREHYDEVAAKYDSIYLTAGYHDHENVLKMCEKLIPDQHLQTRPNLEVLDMGCGTGFVGEVMQKAGFDRITGCDASKGMLDVAAKKNEGKAYINLIELFLGSPDTFPQDLRGKFDIITAAGILAQGHLGPEVFEEMILACKGSGSICIFTTRDMYLTDFGYQAKLDELTNAGKWKLLDILTFTRYDNLGEE